MEPVKPNIIIAAKSFTHRLGIKTILGVLGIAPDVIEANNYEQLTGLLKLPNCISHMILADEIIPDPQKIHFEKLMDYCGEIKFLVLCERALTDHPSARFILHKESSNKVLDAISELLSEPEEDSPQSVESIVLSEREMEVLKQVAQGFSNKEIADALYISVNTVITHRKNLTEKLGIKTIAGLTVYAIMNNLISPKKVQH